MLTGVADNGHQDDTEELPGNVEIGDNIFNRAHQITLEEMIGSISLAGRNVYLVSSIIQYDYTQDPNELDECCLRLSVLDKWS